MRFTFAWSFLDAVRLQVHYPDLIRGRNDHPAILILSDLMTLSNDFISGIIQLLLGFLFPVCAGALVNLSCQSQRGNGWR
jgi:hypothetical protein